MYRRTSGLVLCGIVIAEIATQLVLLCHRCVEQPHEDDMTDDVMRTACVARDWDTVAAKAAKLQPPVLNAALSPDGWCALHFAAAAGADGAVRALLDAGADADVRAKAGSTPLHLATWEGREAAVAALLDSGVDVDARTKAGRTPLHFSAHRGHANIARRLISAGADVHATERDGRQPLHFAAREGYAHVVRVALDNGADAHAADAKGVTPAMAAEKAGHADVLQAVNNKLPNNQPTDEAPKPVPAVRKRTAGGGWATITRTVSDMTSMFGTRASAATEGRAKDDATAVTRGEVYAVVGAGVLVSALIPVVRSAVREG